jgi:hypothetical protein
MRVPVAQSSAIRKNAEAVPARMPSRADRASQRHVAHGREEIGRGREKHDFQIRRNIKTWAAEYRMDGLRPPDDRNTQASSAGLTGG